MQVKREGERKKKIERRIENNGQKEKECMLAIEEKKSIVGNSGMNIDLGVYRERKR